MLVIIAGLPGSGKSFFAARLAERLGAEYISSDKVRISMHALGHYTLKDKVAVYEEMIRQCDPWLKSNMTVVADATFFLQSLRDQFVQLAHLYATPVYMIVVQTQEDTARERLAKPRQDSEADYKVYEKVKDEFEPVTMPHLTLESTDDNIDAMLKRAIAYITAQS